ncbi:DUF1610 domain-containing protein [Altererythrobacter sp. CC-YST694]|nr:DUF1610 domain-containing protein [Altererythrobacter sp. CC-YST694]
MAAPGNNSSSFMCPTCGRKEVIIA